MFCPEKRKLNKNNSGNVGSSKKNPKLKSGTNKTKNIHHNMSNVQKRKLPKDIHSGLPLCRKFMENKPCNRETCRFAHVDRHLRPPCVDFQNWGLCPYGNESCFLVHSRSPTNPLSKLHFKPCQTGNTLRASFRLDFEHETNASKNVTAMQLKYTTQKNFKYPLYFQYPYTDTVTTKSNNLFDIEGASSNIATSEYNLPNISKKRETIISDKHSFICIFCVASGFMSRFLSRFSELYCEQKDKTILECPKSYYPKIMPIEAFRGFTKSAANDTIGVVFAPVQQQQIKCATSKTPMFQDNSGFEIMFPLATEIFSCRHCRGEALFLNKSTLTLDETAKEILCAWSSHMKASLQHNKNYEAMNEKTQNCCETNGNIEMIGAVRVKAFPPARQFSHLLAIHLLLALAKQHENAKHNNIKNCDKVATHCEGNFRETNENMLSAASFPILFPTVHRKTMYDDLKMHLEQEKLHFDRFNEGRSLESSPFFQIPSSDIGIQDALFELHIAPYRGHWLWGFHRIDNKNNTPKNHTITIANSTNMVVTTDNFAKKQLPPISSSTIRDTYFSKHYYINDIRRILGIKDVKKSSEVDDKSAIMQTKLPPVCRAYWKLHEIVVRRPNFFNYLITNSILEQSKQTSYHTAPMCKYAIDIGASPGGWTQFLCDILPEADNKTKLKVVSVDPGELHPKIKEFSNVIHVQKRSEDAFEEIQRLSLNNFAKKNTKISKNNKNNNHGIDILGERKQIDDQQKFDGFDLLVCDANVSATKTLNLVRPVLPLLKSKTARLVITAKNQFSGGNAGIDKINLLFNDELDNAKKMYAKEKLEVAEIIHLFANSVNETTMMLKMIE